MDAFTLVPWLFVLLFVSLGLLWYALRHLESTPSGEQRNGAGLPRCTTCTRSIESDWMYCPICGHALHQPSARTVSERTPEMTTNQIVS